MVQSMMHLCLIILISLISDVGLGINDSNTLKYLIPNYRFIHKDVESSIKVRLSCVDNPCFGVIECFGSQHEGQLLCQFFTTEEESYKAVMINDSVGFVRINRIPFYIRGNVNVFFKQKRFGHKVVPKKGEVDEDISILYDDNCFIYVFRDGVISTFELKTKSFVGIHAE